MVLDTFWYLVDKGPRDFVVIVLFTGVGLLGLFHIKLLKLSILIFLNP
jgi:hypothetical protein